MRLRQYDKNITKKIEKHLKLLRRLIFLKLEYNWKRK